MHRLVVEKKKNLKTNVDSADHPTFTEARMGTGGGEERGRGGEREETKTHAASFHSSSVVFEGEAEEDLRPQYRFARIITNK